MQIVRKTGTMELLYEIMYGDITHDKRYVQN